MILARERRYHRTTRSSYRRAMRPGALPLGSLIGRHSNRGQSDSGPVALPLPSLGSPARTKNYFPAIVPMTPRAHNRSCVRGKTGVDTAPPTVVYALRYPFMEIPINELSFLGRGECQLSRLLPFFPSVLAVLCFHPPRLRRPERDRLSPDRGGRGTFHGRNAITYRAWQSIDPRSFGAARNPVIETSDV